MSRQQPTDVVARDEVSIRTDNTTAHQGLFKAEFTPPIPLEVLGAAQGQVYTEEDSTGSLTIPSAHGEPIRTAA